MGNKLNNYLSILVPNSKKSVQSVPASRSAEVVTKEFKGITWVDVQNPDRVTVDALGKAYDFHPLHLDSSLLGGSLPQQEKEEKYLFLLLHIPSRENQSHKLVTHQIAIFLGKDYIVTLHTGHSHSLARLFERFGEDPNLPGTRTKESSGLMLYEVIRALLDDVALLARSVLKDLDDTEESVFDTDASDAAEIVELRRIILRLKRTVGQLKIVTADLSSHIHVLTRDNFAHHYRQLATTVRWLDEVASEAEETIEIYKDADFTASAERTNEILAVLTIIFTLAIPVTVIGTLYGMNVLLPGGIEAGPWRFLGDYTTFTLVVIASLFPALLMYIYFKKKHWF